jgi:hypothetical protein
MKPVLPFVLVLVTACGGAGQRESAPKQIERALNEDRKTDAKLGVNTATQPESDCGWISAAEAEAVLGPLAEPPRGRGVCHYRLKMPTSVSEARAKAVEQRERFDAALKKRYPDWKREKPRGTQENYETDATNFAMELEVKVDGSFANKPKAATTKSASVEGANGTKAGGGERSSGWDSLTATSFGVSGRIGHVEVLVNPNAPDVPTSLMTALAERVRDRVPDLPFRAKNQNQIQPLHGGGEDPCSLLARDEAEAILGTLVVPPYRSSSYFPALAHPQGLACAYFTAGHHVLSIHPYWSDGERQMKLEKDIGGIVSLVAPQQMMVIKGPWDKTHISLTGSLQVLKGDRLLDLHFVPSSTDLAGAIRLAAQAVKRLPS